MNQPIGIPSEWEEVAAMLAAPPFISYRAHDKWGEAKSSSSDYVESPHDWREAP